MSTSEQEMQALIDAATDAAFPDEPATIVTETEPNKEVAVVQAESAEVKVEDAEIGESEETGVEPPDHWSDADKEFFAAAEPEIQEWLLAKTKAIDADGEEKWQKAGTLKRDNEKLFEYAEQVSEVLKPIADIYERHGKSRMDATREMAAWFGAAMNPDPNIRVQVVRDLIARMKVDPKVIFGTDEDDELADPQVTALKRELAELRNHLNQSAQHQNAAWQQNEQHKERTAQEAADKEIADFSSEKDDQGNLKHPHWSDEKVKRLIGGLLKADSTLELEDAYQTAVKRFGLSEESPAAKIRRAKKAASGVSSKGESVDLSKLSTSQIYDRVMEGK